MCIVNIMSIRKTITITKKQDKFIQEKTINLSRFVQRAIKDAMERERNVVK